MRTKSELLNTWWDPYATSTPLKKIPNQLEVKNKSQRQLEIEADCVNFLKKLKKACNNSAVLGDASTGSKVPVCKRSKKSRLSAYFDVSSSSSDDEVEIKKRPVIKISSTKSAKVVLRNDEPKSEETSPVKFSTSRKPNTNNKILSTISTETRTPTVEISKCKDSQVQKENNKAQTKADSSFDKVRADSDEENKILNKSTRSKKLKPCLKNKGNDVICSKNDLNSRHPSDFSETEKKKLQTVSKANRTLLKPKPIEKNTCVSSQDVGSYQKTSTDNNKSSKLQKKNTKKPTDSSGPTKKRIRKAASKSVTPPPPEKMVSSLKSHVGQDKSNLSHQLFSESTELEYINTLNLASDEMNEAAESTRCSEPFIWPYPSSHKVCSESKTKEKRPKRRQQALREFWLPQSCKILPGKGIGSQETSEKNESQTQELKLFALVEQRLGEENSEKISQAEKSSIKEQEENETEKVEVVNAVENKTVADDHISENFQNNQNNGDDAMKPLGLSSETSANKPSLKGTKKSREDNAVNSSEKSVFKKSDELSFHWNGTGCSVVQCWNANQFKCGVFKLKINSSFKCKTVHSNSHLGGVLIKGKIRMKIGMREQDLKEGDMAFVPPLTEWEATNTGECESVFYYWCGSFES